MGVKYENGSIHSPVIELGEDPANSNNVLVSRLETAVSVPAWTITEEEGTPEAPAEVPAGTSAEKDAEIADLKAKLEAHESAAAEQTETTGEENQEDS